MPKPITSNTLFDCPGVYAITIKVSFDGDRVATLPYSSGQTFKQAEKVRKSQGKQGELGI